MRLSRLSLKAVPFVLLSLNIGLRISAQTAAPAEQKAGEQHAVAQLRAIVDEIRKCPDHKIMNSDGSGANIYAPMNVVWDVKPQDSFRSKEMGFIEFVQHSDYIPGKLESCKKRDSRCKLRNDVTSDMNSIMSGVNSPDHFRYEFDFGPSGLEFNRALMKHETEDATHWLATRLGNGCEAKAVLSIVN